VLRSARYRIELQVDFQFSSEELEIRVETAVAEPRRPAAPEPLAEDADPDVGMSLVEALMDTLDLEVDEETGAVSMAMTRALPEPEAREG
jgi:hypothetical protein